LHCSNLLLTILKVDGKKKNNFVVSKVFIGRFLLKRRKEKKMFVTRDMLFSILTLRLIREISLWNGITIPLE
jgi:hypothetical protein